MKKRNVIIDVKIDMAEGEAGLFFEEATRKINDSLPHQTKISNMREENGRWVYADLTDFDIGLEVNERAEAYVRGLITGYLISKGVNTL